MGVVLDHTIVPVRDQAEAVDFYTRVLGFEDAGRIGPFAVVRLNDSATLDFEVWKDIPSMHYAFAYEPEEFERAFQRIKDSPIAYGDHYSTRGNMKGPGASAGAKGEGKSVYFLDPSGHRLEIRTY